MDIKAILDELAIFRNLPTYQLERRLDPFVMHYIAGACAEKFDIADLQLVYPEWPLFLTDDKASDPCISRENMQSNYADYLLYSAETNQVILLEYKTDGASISRDQYQNYILNCQAGWRELWMSYLDKATNNPAFWRKYCYGIDLIHKRAPVLTGYDKPFDLHKYYSLRRRTGKTKALRQIMPLIKFKEVPRMKVAYLAPASCLSSFRYWQEQFDPDMAYTLGFISLGDLAALTPPPLSQLLLEVEEKHAFAETADTLTN